MMGELRESEKDKAEQNFVIVQLNSKRREIVFTQQSRRASR